MAGLTYTIKKNTLNKALLIDMEVNEHGGLSATGGDMHYAFLAPLDSGVEDCPWGRLNFEMTLPQNTMCYMYAVATNNKQDLMYMLDPDKSVQDKEKMIYSIGGVRFINKDDVVLYHSSGRYLCIAFEIIGEGVELNKLTAYAPGDNFMQVFPEVYRDKNSFFHRYLSVFSSIYNDFQYKLDKAEYLLDIDKAPVELLYLYTRWLGIDVSGGFLDEDTLRNLLKEAGEILPRKGTKYAIEHICEIVIGEKPIIVERCLMDGYIQHSVKENYDDLYGDSPYDVTLLINNYVSDRKKEQLLHLLEQFKPIRTRLKVVFLEESGVLDGHSYMDQNAVTFNQTEGVLDRNQSSDGTVILS